MSGPYPAIPHAASARIEDYGGTVEKFIGDAVMAVFGAPLAHEDDAERAIRAGLRILDAIAEANADDPALDLKVRIGINTGEAVVSLGARPEQGEGFVTGDVVNTASRLQGVAPVNGIAVGEATHEATASIFEFEELEPVELKGKAEPVRLWWAKAARSRFGTDVTRTHTTPLVGRELERDLLTATFERAVRDRSVHLVTVVGEPGIGKSRLVAELFAYSDRSPDLVTWRQGRCLPYGEGIAFWALGEIVKAAAGILETDAPDVAAEKIDLAVQTEQADARWLRQRLRPLVGLDAPAAAREENFAAWRRFLEIVAGDGPLVLVVEDLHWADEALLAFLEEVVEFVTGVSMVVLVTARPELFERAPGFAQSARNSNRVNLAPLSEAETAQLTAMLLDSTVLPAEVSSLVVERAGGNPLYAEEFVRLLKDRGLLRRDGVSWVSAPDAGEIPLPSGVQGLIAARLDTLEPDRKRLLQDASVLGKVFWSGGLAAMGDEDPAQIDAVLHELGRRELVRRQPSSSMAGETEYAFWHALVRDVCYGQIPRSQRIERHTTAAGWIESAAGMRLEDHAEILAGHYTAALELAVATGRPDEADRLSEAARRYLTLAGDRSLGLDVAGAEALYRSALELTPEGTPERAHLLAKLAEVLLQRARFSEANEMLDAAHALFLADGDVRSAAVTLARTSVILARMGDTRARGRTIAALELLEPLPPGPELVQVLSEYAGEAFISDDLDRTIEASKRAIEVAETLGMPTPARALGFLGGARSLADPAGIDDLRQAMAISDEQGLGREGCVIRNNIANSIATVDGPRAGLEAWRDSVEFARRRGSEEFVSAGLQGEVECLTLLGRWDEALSQADALRPALVDANDFTSLAFLNACALLIELARGRTDLATMGDPLVAYARTYDEAQVSSERSRSSPDSGSPRMVRQRRSP